MEITGPGSKDVGERGQIGRGRVVIYDNDLNRQASGGLAGQPKMGVVTKQQDGVAIQQELADLIDVEGGVAGDGRVAGSEDAEVSGNPLGMIGAKKGALGAALDAGLQQPTSNGLCHVAQLRERVTLDSRSAGSDGRRLMLQFNRNQVWITLYRFLEAVVEHRVNNPIFAGLNAVAYLTASVNAIARSGGKGYGKPIWNAPSQ